MVRNSRVVPVIRAVALFAAVLLGVFLVAEPACAHADPGSGAGRTERVEPAERAEPKREDCPARRGASGGLRVVLPATACPPLPSSRSGSAAGGGCPADADPDEGRAGATAAPVPPRGRYR